MTNDSNLRNDALAHLEKLTGPRWTDFNAHDPGITLLEAFCYALTDLGYRTDHDIPDLLADGGSTPYKSLHDPAELLTTRAVTPDDLRRLVLDVPGVKNAWVEPIDERLPDTEVPVLGIFRLAIETSAERDGTAVRREVGRRLHKHRGLCEDFTDIVILDPLDICVDARVEIGRVDDPAITYGQILDAISEIISPTIPFATLNAQLEAGLDLDAIFRGPLLDHGFVTDEALAKARRRAAVHASDIVHAVMDVPGIRAVTEVMIRSADKREAWSLELPKDRAPRLDRTNSRIILQSGGLPVAIGKPPAAPPHPLRVKRAALVPPPASDRHVQTYHSVQHHLPMLYGISAAGLSETVSDERKGLAKQLQAYMMFFDQLLANYLAQLAHVKDLFSIDPTAGQRTYYTQIVDEPTLGLDDVALARQTDLDALVETDAARLARKHRFLNHLLARFAENLNDRFTASGGDAPGASEELILQKQAFLGQYPRISGSRGTAADGLGAWGKDNPSGLEDRIRFKLGLFEQDGEKLAMIEHILMRPSQLHRFESFLNQLPNGLQDPYSLRLTFVFPAEKGRFGVAGPDNDFPFRKIVEQTLRSQTPAHIGTYVLWLNDTDWDRFLVDYAEWRRRRREHLATKLGISLGLDARLYTTVVNLPPLPGVPAEMSNPPWIADYGATADVTVDGTQEGGAGYSLERETDKAPFSSTAVIGTGKLITIPSLELTEDLVLRVRVERLFDDSIRLDTPLPVKVRANPNIGVEPTTLMVAHGANGALTLRNSQASVTYRAYMRPLVDEDYFVPANTPALETRIPALTNPPRPEATVRVTIPPIETNWDTAGFTAAPSSARGNDGTSQLPLGAITQDCVVFVRAHKDHGANPVDATDLRIVQTAMVLARPAPVPALTLVSTSANTIALTNGEPGVLYYLLDAATNLPLGKPAYFHRKDETDATLNQGIGQLRVGRDLAVARGPVAANVPRSTTSALDPVVRVNAIPANRQVKVMAIRARTGVSWEAAQTKAIGTTAAAS